MHNSLDSVEEFQHIWCEKTKGVKYERYEHMLIFNACILLFCYFSCGGFQSNMSRYETLTPQTHKWGDPNKIHTSVFPSYQSKKPKCQHA